MNRFSYETSKQAWVGINKELIYATPETFPKAVIMSNQVILYDVFIEMGKSYIPEDWDFTKTVNYTKAKWTSLVNNYLDRDHTEQVMALIHHRELKKDKNYNITMWFSNLHGGGKGCLVSCTFSRRYGEEQPTLNVVMRASEFYKRGMFDLLLVHRLGQEAFGEDASFGLNITAHQLWGGADWLSLLSSVINPRRLFKEIEPGSFREKVYKNYQKFQDEGNIDEMKYHAHKRACKVIQKKVNPKRLLASDCVL